MEISPQTVSESWRLGGSLRPGCGTWTGSFCPWVLIWMVKGKWNGYVNLVHGVPCGGHEEDLCTCHFHGFCSVYVDCRIGSLWGSQTSEDDAQKRGCGTCGVHNCGSGSAFCGYPGRHRSGRNCEGNGAPWPSSG